MGITRERHVLIKGRTFLSSQEQQPSPRNWSAISLHSQGHGGCDMALDPVSPALSSWADFSVIDMVMCRTEWHLTHRLR